MLLLQFYFFFFNDTATTEIYTLSLHDALPIWPGRCSSRQKRVERSTRVPMKDLLAAPAIRSPSQWPGTARSATRSEEHTSELQSRQYLVCRLLLEKKKITYGK